MKKGWRKRREEEREDEKRGKKGVTASATSTFKINDHFVNIFLYFLLLLHYYSYFVLLFLPISYAFANVDKQNRIYAFLRLIYNDGQTLRSFYFYYGIYPFQCSNKSLTDRRTFLQLLDFHFFFII